MAVDGKDLEILKMHSLLFLRHLQTLSGNIGSFTTDIDISSKQNFTQVRLT